jgi:hypothetical protein
MVRSGFLVDGKSKNTSHSIKCRNEHEPKDILSPESN